MTAESSSASLQSLSAASSDSLESVEGRGVSGGDVEAVKGSVESLRRMRNDAEQIMELDQYLASTSREIVGELAKILGLIDRRITVRNPTVEDGNVLLDSRGILIWDSGGGEMETLQLVELSPQELLTLLGELIPKMGEMVSDQKRRKEILSDSLIQILDSLQ